MEGQPQDENFPWFKIFDYKDELNDHFEDINERILMVSKGDMNRQVAEKLNKKSILKFHGRLTKFIRNNNIII